MNNDTTQGQDGYWETTGNIRVFHHTRPTAR